MKFYIFTYNASTNTILTVWYKTVNRYILRGTIARDLKPGQNIWNKTRKSSNIGQEKKN